MTSQHHALQFVNNYEPCLCRGSKQKKTSPESHVGCFASASFPSICIISFNRICRIERRSFSICGFKNIQELKKGKFIKTAATKGCILHVTGRIWFGFFLYFDHTLYHVECGVNARQCSDVMEAQQWTLGREGSGGWLYTVFTAGWKRLKSGFKEFPWQQTCWANRQGDVKEHHK